jgi:CRISPR-associated endonuclease/helicase Cas3
VKLLRADFPTFFAAMHDGHQPFAWQERLLDSLLAEGRWPSQVVAPTGAGKTAVIDVHVFAQALGAAGEAPPPPRRLAMVVGRRVLVDDQHRYAIELARRLASPDGEGSEVLAAIRDLLWTLRAPDADRRVELVADPDLSPLLVGRLRGGSPPSRTWRDHPSAAAVICATPDMWGSRLLFRGYGSSSLAWPREAGLLAFDSVVVVDEAHLASQLLCTARRVAELAIVAERGIGTPALQVVETTATPRVGDAASVGVELADLDADDALSQRLTRAKPVTLVPVKDWDSVKPAAKAPVVLADAVAQLVGEQATADNRASHTVGCFVNTVGRAVAVAHELRRRNLRVVMVCGQVRTVDLERLDSHYPGILTPAGNDTVDVLVSTQSLEVGVDLDLASLVTELASGSALAQRAGRVNRRGLRAHGRVVVTVPEEGTLSERVRSGPYGFSELMAALQWVQGRAADPDGVAPWSLRSDPPPPAGDRRMLLQRPELAQAWHWARTSDALAAEPDLQLWLSDDLTDDTSLGIVVRDSLPDDPSDAAALLQALPPRRHEVFSVPYRTARDMLTLRHDELPSAYVVRGDDVGPLEWRPTDSIGLERQPRLRPGDIVVLDSTAEMFTDSAQFSPPVLVPAEAEHITRHRADDVLEAQADLPAERWAAHEIGGVVLRVELGSEQPELAEKALVAVLTSEQDVLDVAASRDAVSAWLAASHRMTAMASAAANLLAGPPTRSDVIVQRDENEMPTRVIVIDRRRAVTDDELRQVWTPAGHLVALDAHQQDVADRAGLLGHALGLDDELVQILVAAGAHHDDGKRDPRFQLRLGARVDTLLAKSPGGTSVEQARRNNQLSGLPTGWRHEQRSVLDAWTVLAETPDRDLVARLIGTSHGYGRSAFPHSAREMLPDHGPTAAELFDRGGWDDIIERTQKRYGAWACAFLEALLRAADGQISGEGR